jgi:hypothetical protein
MLRGADEPGLKQVDLAAAIHLAFDELETSDLPLGLGVGLSTDRRSFRTRPHRTVLPLPS